MKAMSLLIPVNESDHAIGPANAPIAVVNYGDYQCPDCHRPHREVEKIFDQLVNRSERIEELFGSG
jgi:protein-disulfide isomerase